MTMRSRVLEQALAVAMLTVVILTVAILTVAILAVAILVVAILTVALPTIALLYLAVPVQELFETRAQLQALRERRATGAIVLR